MGSVNPPRELPATGPSIAYLSYLSYFVVHVVVTAAGLLIQSVQAGRPSFDLMAVLIGLLPFYVLGLPLGAVIAAIIWRAVRRRIVFVLGGLIVIGGVNYLLYIYSFSYEPASPKASAWLVWTASTSGSMIALIVAAVLFYRSKTAK
jgi:hypothetical protein